ncbi:MAG: hypothetical protein NXH75_06690 [Halobacteriovoraceae bacterium]|nr:hypothetical protein [Halobacteriovoraceae bacterium]
METKTSAKEYEILGYKVKLQKSDEINQVTPDDVVDLVRSEAAKIMDKAPTLNSGEVAILVALKMAQENLSKAETYNDEIDALKSKANEALSLIEEVTPTSM